jgi:hypothetical protein
MEPASADEEEKRCARCSELKPAAAYHRRAEGRQSWCKDCRRDWDAAYHQRRRDVRTAQKRVRKQGLIAWMQHFKRSRPCADCGGFFHPAAMTFDHLPGSRKRADVSTLLYGGYRQVLLDEMAKCELVCANCHAVRTYVRDEHNPRSA